MSDNKGQVKYYAVMTLVGGFIVSTWPMAQAIAANVGGQEYHKKFYSKDEAKQWLEEKAKQMKITGAVMDSVIAWKESDDLEKLRLREEVIYHQPL